MSTTYTDTLGQGSAAKKREERKVLAGTLVGTTIEWYDFFIYAQAAGLVLAPLFFEPMGESGSQIAAWASLGISFLVRPLGAIVAGHVGDKFGRKVVLVFTLIGMGAATVLIGLLPTYATIGIWAPILLILFRLLQGFSAGGEWGGAALMSVEHAPRGKRGLFGAYPQIGVPLGMILATIMIFGISTFMDEEQFMSWGWRIPFLFSFILIIVGHLIRKAVEESPVFQEMQRLKKEESAPLGDLFRGHSTWVVLAALIFAANNAAGYLVIAYFNGYGVKALGMERTETLAASLIGGFGWLVFTLFGGWISDKIGRKLTFLIGYGIVIAWAIPMWSLLNTASLPLFALAVFILTIGLGPSYGPQSAMYAEMFPANVRFSGISIGYALGSIIGGAFAPMISDLILQRTGNPYLIGVYIAALGVVSFIAVCFVPNGIQDRDLHDHRDEISDDPVAEIREAEKQA
ncbi:L-Proline/Glycine betaine transporter ProP [Micrococcus lylae]|uniref:L-Proline/Glycine betaine transporter ProP n=1 Tax=Micrococcus lylae TaxID=1273 RepID=A0A1R4J0U5_9MICC|nr:MULTISPECIES: MFS transporter [Micrococcus]OFR88305.1 MFS transporter [Micrococcus sp. HMSC067E09]PNL18747.1 MFS transporter [Micrococcus sp. FDAARGOS_333]TFH98783.1 MFS transporter [Micrococcus lylae]WIK81494.1 MFS transporter [Micrococcus lylae]SJN25781.1 L-Proline/Glycine betaine transporter ProP [Micrococcus lylae]